MKDLRQSIHWQLCISGGDELDVQTWVLESEDSIEEAATMQSSRECWRMSSGTKVRDGWYIARCDTDDKSFSIGFVILRLVLVFLPSLNYVGLAVLFDPLCQAFLPWQKPWQACTLRSAT